MQLMEPMLPTLVKVPFSNSNWIFEPKWDGYRAVCFENGTVRFISRRQNSLTEKFPTLQGIAKSIKANVAVLDGEIVALDRDGVPTFEGLRSKRSTESLIVYFAFDLLTLEGRDLTELPLIERKAALKRILPAAPDRARPFHWACYRRGRASLSRTRRDEAGGNGCKACG